MNLDFNKCRLTPFEHQKEDTLAMMKNPYYFIASEMRTGKSKIVVDGAQFLYEQGTIDTVIVVAPSPVRDVWFDPELGEWAKHGWVNMEVTDFHSKCRVWKLKGPRHGDQPLQVLVTNYEFLRSKNRLRQILLFSGHKTLLVLDESSYVKNYRSIQTKACLQLRRRCGRVVLVNGTPVYQTPLDLFSQANILHPSILDCSSETVYKARYAVMDVVRGASGRPLTNAYGKAIQKVVDWVNLEDIQKRLARCTVRRLQAECLDLPPKLDPVVLTATLKPATWRAYCDMRDELVSTLGDGQIAVSSSAANRILRLSQITSGFVGGVEDSPLPSLINDVDDFDRFMSIATSDHAIEIGREKLDTLLWFLEQRLEAEPAPKVVAWCRFRREMFRIEEEVRERFPQFEVGSIHGGQKQDQRRRSLSLLKPETSPNAPVLVVGIEGTGSFGLDMTASHTCVTMSTGYSAGKLAQTLDRVYGPAQTHPIAYYNIHAVGPAGQPTIDHVIDVAVRKRDNLATWTADAWVKALRKER